MSSVVDAVVDSVAEPPPHYPMNLYDKSFNQSYSHQ